MEQVIRYFKAAFRKKVTHNEGTEDESVNTWTEIRPLSSEYLTLPYAWRHATEKAIEIFIKEDMPLEWIQEIDQYEWETL